jgi:hypothetical protein
VGLEMSPLSLVSTTEEPLRKNSSGCGLEIREYGRGDPLCWPRDTLNPQKLALTSPTNGGLLVGIGRWRTKAPELLLLHRMMYKLEDGGFDSRWGHWVLYFT